MLIFFGWISKILQDFPLNVCKYLKGLVTHKRKSLSVDMRSIAKNCFRLFDLLLYIPVNSYDHTGKLDVERDVKQ